MAFIFSGVFSGGFCFVNGDWNVHLKRRETPTKRSNFGGCLLEDNREKNGEVQRHLAILSWKGEHKETIVLWEELLKDNPGNNSIKRELAESFGFQGWYAKGLAIWGSVIRETHRPQCTEEIGGVIENGKSCRRDCSPEGIVGCI
jgi:hypothetical protein